VPQVEPVQPVSPLRALLAILRAHAVESELPQAQSLRV
jgi:hypothetical protein